MRCIIRHRKSRPFSNPPSHPTNGRSPPPLLSKQPHPVGLKYSLLRKANGRSPHLSSTNPTQSVSKFYCSESQTAVLHPQHNQPTAVIPSTNPTQPVSKFYCSESQTAVLHPPTQPTNGRSPPPIAHQPTAPNRSRDFTIQEAKRPFSHHHHNQPTAVPIPSSQHPTSPSQSRYFATWEAVYQSTDNGIPTSPTCRKFIPTTLLAFLYIVVEMYH